MKTIRAAYSTVQTVLGNQKYKQNADYKKTLFCVEADRSEGRLLYHTLTGELLLLEDCELESWNQDLMMKKTMAEHWFLVPRGMDEIKQCDQLRYVAGLLQKERPYVNHFIVFPTTDCNARCFYCFEHGQRRYSMSEQTAADVADYMLAQAKGETIRIRWFGGEPLFNAGAIDIISEKLRQHGADYKASMVSNTYLFDEDMIARARELWHLKHVLVTIDGTEEVYNRTKAYIYREGSAYRRVLRNIRGLIDAEIGVTVNLLMDAGNASIMFDLADELGQLFSGSAHFKARGGLLIEYVGKLHAFASVEEALSTAKRLNERLESHGIREHRRLRSNMKLHCCMANDIHSVTILPDGRLGRCEHFGDSEAVGSIYGFWDNAKAHEWKAVKPVEERCRTCPFYPHCFRLKKCNSSPDTCDELFQGKYRMYFLDLMQNTFEHNLKKMEDWDESDM